MITHTWKGGHFPRCHKKILFTYHWKFPMTLMVWSASEAQVIGRWTTTWRSVNTWSPGSEAFMKYSNTPVWSAKFGASLNGGLPNQKIKYISTPKHYFSSVYSCFQKFPLKISSRILTYSIKAQSPKLKFWKLEGDFSFGFVFKQIPVFANTLTKSITFFPMFLQKLVHYSYELYYLHQEF